MIPTLLKYLSQSCAKILPKREKYSIYNTMYFSKTEVCWPNVKVKETFSSEGNKFFLNIEAFSVSLPVKEKCHSWERDWNQGVFTHSENQTSLYIFSFTISTLFEYRLTISDAFEFLQKFLVPLILPLKRAKPILMRITDPGSTRSQNYLLKGRNMYTHSKQFVNGEGEEGKVMFFFHPFFLTSYQFCFK